MLTISAFQYLETLEVRTPRMCTARVAFCTNFSQRESGPLELRPHFVPLAQHTGAQATHRASRLDRRGAFSRRASHGHCDDAGERRGEARERAAEGELRGLQKIIYYDFLPVMLDDTVAPYAGYKRHLPPGISHSFATTAFRFPHSIVPPAMLFRIKSDKCQFRTEVAGFPAVSSAWRAR